MGFHFRGFFDMSKVSVTFYVIQYHIPDKGNVIIYRILTIMNCTHIWNNKIRFGAKIVLTIGSCK